MAALLTQLAQRGAIGWLSYHFAEFIAAQARAEPDDLLCLSAALLCEANQQGSVCIDLHELAGKPMFDADGAPRAPAAATWSAALSDSACVGAPGSAAPLTLDRGRLYLQRFWHYENFIAAAIEARLDADDATGFEHAETRFAQLFGASPEIDADQRHAVLTAVSRRFCIVSGGPGSGKTSTVVRILALLLALAPGTRIALAAPTGKAAARMIESIRERIDRLDLADEIRTALPVEAPTLHRLLGYRHREFGYDQRHPLPLDCLVVDEASMVDARLMYHTLAALPAHARLILLGDRDQLASVAAGNVLGDITGHGFDLDSSAPRIAQSIALLGGNYRFGSDSAIGELAMLVNSGRCDSAIELLQQDRRGLHWRQPERIDAVALESIIERYQPIFDSRSPAAALDAFDATRVLCVTNRGEHGIDNLNRLIGETLLARNRIAAGEHYQGLPIMISRNHHALGLYNGDTGLLWRSPNGLRACFREAGGGVRDLALHRLPEFAPAWATTVHKAQGSEFDEVLLILPTDAESEGLNRELIYTAITRARRRFLLYGDAYALRAAIERLTQRHSGLATRLGWPGRAPAQSPPEA